MASAGPVTSDAGVAVGPAPTVGIRSPAFVLTAVAAFMVAIDNLVVATALPAIRRSFDTDIAGLQWIVSAYTLTYAVLQLSCAALGDRIGRRKVFLAGLALFVGASAGAAAAPTIWLLVAARAAQGLGAAMVSPLALTIVAHATPRVRRAAVLAVWGAIGGIGSAIGPVIGGTIVNSAPWQWIFLVNLPVGLVILPLGWLKIKESRGPHDRLDVLGVALSSAALVGLLYALINGNDLGWTHPAVAGGGVAAAVLLGAFVVAQRRAAHPMLPLELLRRSGFATSVTLYLLMTFGLFGTMFLATQYCQNGLGYSPLQAGLAIAPAATLPVLVAPFTGLISRRFGAGPVLATGLALQAAGLGWLGLVITPRVSYLRLLPSLLVLGVAAGLFFGQISRVILESVPTGYEGIAAGVGTTFRQLGTVLGIAVLGAAFAAYGGYQDAVTFTHGFSVALWVGASSSALATLLALTLPRERPTSGTPSSTSEPPRSGPLRGADRGTTFHSLRRRD
jgi:EmrB/QacA subfamily drug resistance transporter